MENETQYQSNGETQFQSTPQGPGYGQEFRSVPAGPQSPQAIGKWAYSRVNFALVIIAVLVIVLQTALYFILEAGAHAGNGICADLLDGPWTLIVLSSAPMYLVAFPVGIHLMHRVPVAKPAPSGMSAAQFFRTLVIAVPVMYIGNIIGTVLSMLFSGGQAVNPLEDIVSTLTLPNILILVIVGPFLEEFVFRKTILDRCSIFGEKGAIVFSALVFGMFHMNFFQFFYAFGLGLVFGYVYTRTRKIRYSFCMHAIINFFGGVVAPFLAGRAGNLDPAALEEEIAALERQLAGGAGSVQISPELAAAMPALMALGVYGIAILMLSVVGIIFLIQSRKRIVFYPTPEQLPKGTVFRTIYGNVWFLVFAAICVALSVMSLFSVSL